MNLDRNRVPGDVARRVNHLANAESLSVSQVQNQAALLLQRVQGQQMRIGEVGDVNVVADAGSVRRGVVLAIDADGLAPAQRNIKHQWDEVRLRLMRLAAGHAIWEI